MVVLREVVHDGVADLDLLVRKLSTPKCAVPAPVVTHDDAKLDVSLHVGYISPPKASIHLEHDAVTPINVCITDVLIVTKMHILVHADEVGAQIRNSCRSRRINGGSEVALVAEPVLVCHISSEDLGLVGHSLRAPDWNGRQIKFRMIRILLSEKSNHVSKSLGVDFTAAEEISSFAHEYHKQMHIHVFSVC